MNNESLRIPLMHLHGHNNECTMQNNQVALVACYLWHRYTDAGSTLYSTYFRDISLCFCPLHVYSILKENFQKINTPNDVKWSIHTGKPLRGSHWTLSIHHINTYLLQKSRCVFKLMYFQMLFEQHIACISIKLWGRNIKWI